MLLPLINVSTYASCSLTKAWLHLPKFSLLSTLETQRELELALGETFYIFSSIREAQVVFHFPTLPDQT